MSVPCDTDGHNVSWLDRVQIQRYDRLLDARPSVTLSLGAALDSIVDGTYAAPITRLRDIYAQQGEDAYRQAKQRLPALTFAGTFSPTRAKANLAQHSGLVHADVDHLPNVYETKLALMQDPCVAYIFTSPRSDGLKYGTRTTPVDSDTAYQHAWQVLAEAHLQQYGVTWDPSGKDSSRLCFVSWDPAAYMNPDASVYPIPPMVVPQPPPVTTYRHWPSPRLRTAAQRALERAVDMIAQAPPGAQHAARCRAAYLVGGYVASGELSDAEALAALEVAVSATAKNSTKAMRDITDALRAGQDKPITTPYRRSQDGHWRQRASTPREAAAWRKC
jgi:VirE N-terminal domain